MFIWILDILILFQLCYAWMFKSRSL